MIPSDLRDSPKKLVKFLLARKGENPMEFFWHTYFISDHAWPQQTLYVSFAHDASTRLLSNKNWDDRNNDFVMKKAKKKFSETKEPVKQVVKLDQESHDRNKLFQACFHGRLSETRLEQKGEAEAIEEHS